MKKLLLFIGFISLTINAQAPAIQWQKTLGGTGYDNSSSIQQTADGGYIVTGATQSNDGDLTGNHGGQDVWVMKLNSAGIIQWQKTLGGTGIETANSIKQTSDGGYILAGFTTSNNGDVTGNHGSNDFWVVKLNSVGVIQWQKALGGSSNDQAYSIQQTTDDGYIVVGSTTSVNGDVIGGVSGNSVDIWVVKLNSAGDITMQNTYGGLGNDIAYSVQQTPDGYILAGSTDLSSNTFVVGNGGYDAWIMKITNNGSIIWLNAYGGNSDEYFYNIQKTTDGNYILAGSSNSFSITNEPNSTYEFWLVKISNSNGDVQWQNSFGGTGDEKAKSIQQTTDGGYIVVGTTNSADGDLTGNNIGVGGDNIWVVKLYNTGTLQWQETLGGTGNEIGTSIQQSTDGGYIVAGFTNSNDGEVIGNHGSFDAWVVKLELDPTPTAGFCQAFTFSDLNNMNTARGLISSATDGSNIYVCNGFSPAVNYTTQIEKYNIATNTWSFFSNTNAGLRYSSAEVVGNKLYVFNGIPSSTTFNNKMEVIDLITGVVTYSTDNPSPVYSAGSSVWDGKIYSFGGTGSSGNSAKLYVFDPQLQTWTQLADMPQAKQSKGEIINGKLYVIGGFDGSSLTSIDCYDIQNNTWSHLMDMPASNSANATSAFQNKIWVIGDYTNQTFVGYYDVLTNQFVSIQSNIIGRRHAGAIALNNNLYAFGGDQTSLPNSSLNSLQVASIDGFTSVPNVGYVTPQTYTIGTAINPLTPISTSSCNLTYSINPNLPTGLNLDTATGIISGTPTASSPTTIYAVTACNGFVCVTSTLVLSPTTLGVNDFSNYSLKLYPNPASSLINVQSSNNVVLDKISITDLTGKIVMEQTQNTNQINVEKLASGVYILNAYSEGGKYQEKFIKE